MKHNIINRRESITVFTEVEYTFDGVTEIIEIPHFEPKSEEEILQNIQNRYESELVMRDLNNNGE